MTRRLNPKPALNPVYGYEARGVAGWLALLWIGLVFLSPGLAALGAMRLYSHPRMSLLPEEVFRSMELVEWSVVAVTAAICWFLAWRLSRVQVWRSVQIVIVGLWAHAILVKLGEFAGLSIATGLPFTYLVSGAGGNLIVPVVVAAIWTLYLLRSGRVERTYPRRPSDRETAATFD